jgi:hypothetical protein
MPSHYSMHANLQGQLYACMILAHVRLCIRMWAHVCCESWCTSKATLVSRRGFCVPTSSTSLPTCSISYTLGMCSSFMLRSTSRMTVWESHYSAELVYTTSYRGWFSWPVRVPASALLACPKLSLYLICYIKVVSHGHVHNFATISPGQFETDLFGCMTGHTCY